MREIVRFTTKNIDAEPYDKHVTKTTDTTIRGVKEQELKEYVAEHAMH